MAVSVGLGAVGVDGGRDGRGERRRRTELELGLGLGFRRGKSREQGERGEGRGSGRPLMDAGGSASSSREGAPRHGAREIPVVTGKREN